MHIINVFKKECSVDISNKNPEMSIKKYVYKKFYSIDFMWKCEKVIKFKSYFVQMEYQY
jgi:hypothetical protein